MTNSGESAYLSTVAAAAALQVSVSTVKRWVDEGVLPAHRTPGGHRKLLRSEVVALARQNNLPRGDLAGVGMPTAPDPAAVVLRDALLRGEGDKVGAIIRKAHSAGIAIETMADRMIAPVMAQIGRDWEAGRIDIWEEHRATQLCAAALFDLKSDLERRAEKKRMMAIGGAPQGDPYVLATLLAQLVLLDCGWDAINLGPNTPPASLALALRELRPRLIWLSVSHLIDTDEFIAAYCDLYRAAEQADVAVVVGGRGLTEAVRLRVPYTAFGDSLSHLSAFARTLHPRPKPPRRGRPSKGSA